LIGPIILNFRKRGGGVAAGKEKKTPRQRTATTGGKGKRREKSHKMAGYCADEGKEGELMRSISL